MKTSQVLEYLDERYKSRPRSLDHYATYEFIKDNEGDFDKLGDGDEITFRQGDLRIVCNSVGINIYFPDEDILRFFMTTRFFARPKLYTGLIVSTHGGTWIKWSDYRIDRNAVNQYLKGRGQPKFDFTNFKGYIVRLDHGLDIVSDKL